MSKIIDLNIFFHFLIKWTKTIINNSFLVCQTLVWCSTYQSSQLHCIIPQRMTLSVDSIKSVYSGNPNHIANKKLTKTSQKCVWWWIMAQELWCIYDRTYIKTLRCFIYFNEPGWMMFKHVLLLLNGNNKTGVISALSHHIISQAVPALVDVYMIIFKFQFPIISITGYHQWYCLVSWSCLYQTKC